MENYFLLQMQKIQKQLSALEEMQNGNDKHVRLKADNVVLQERIHLLEEQLQQLDDRWQEKFRDERQTRKDLQVNSQFFSIPVGF